MRYLLLVVTVLFASLAQSASEFVHINEPQAEDVYAVGRDVEVTADTAQDVTLAGQRIAINGQVGGDVIAAGEAVMIRGEVADDVRAAGRIVTVTGKVGDHLVAAGQEVSIDQGAEVIGKAWLAGDTVRVDGRVGGNLQVAGRKVILAGEIAGNVEIAAQEIAIKPRAVVLGNLVWRSSNAPDLNAEARITGEVIQKPLPKQLVERPDSRAGILFDVGLIIAVGAAYLLFPRPCLATALAAQSSPWKSLALGLMLLVVTPIVVVLLLATVVGAFLALMLLALYLFILMLGYVAGLFTLGDFGLRLIGKRDDASRTLRLLAVVAAVVALALLQMVPILGGLAGMLVWLIGLGAVVLMLCRACPKSVVA